MDDGNSYFDVEEPFDVLRTLLLDCGGL